MFELLSQSGGDVINPQVGAPHILFIVIIALQAVLFIAALITILGSKRYTGGGKFLWLIVVFFAPLLGPIGWFLAGRNAQIRTDVP
jgi:hypothetical protein